MVLLIVVAAAAAEDDDDAAAIAAAPFRVTDLSLGAASNMRGIKWEYTLRRFFFSLYFFVARLHVFFGAKRGKSCASLSLPTRKIPNTITNTRRQTDMASFVTIVHDIQYTAWQGQSGAMSRNTRTSTAVRVHDCRDELSGHDSS